MRTRLLLVVAALLLPLLGVLVYVLLDVRAREREHAAERVVRLAHIIAASERQIMRNVADFLAMLARSPAVRGSDARECEQALRSLQQSQPYYANLGVIDVEGRLWCSAVPGPAMNLADRSYFRNAIASRAFAVGEYQVGRVTGRPAINFGFPLATADGTIRGVVFAALDVRVLNQLARSARLPEGAVITLIDERGTILTREPGHDVWTGRTFPAGAVRSALEARPDSGIVIGRGVDGVERLHAYTAVDLAGASKRLAVITGTPVSAVFGHVRGVVIYTSLAFASVVALGLGAAWFTADRLVITRVQTLIRTAERWTRGDLSARTGVANSTDELGELARGLDVMAERLEQHAQEQSRQAESARFLAEAGNVLASSLDAEQTLQNLSELCVARFADWCLIYLRATANTPAFLHSYHGNAAQRALLKNMMREYPSDPEAADRPLGRVLQTQQSLLIEEISPALLNESARDAAHREMLAELGFCSIMIVPLLVRGRCIGALSLMSAESKRRFTADDVVLAEELGRRAAFAVENARLYRSAQNELADRKRAEDEVRRLNEELESKVQARTAELQAVNHELESFSYSVSHDLRSPLRSIAGFSQAVDEDYAPLLDERGRDYLRRLRAGAQRMGQLIDDLLQLSRVTRHNLVHQQVDLTEVAQQTARELQESDPARRVAFEIKPGLEGTGDPNLLRIVLSNLLSNAWKFTSRTEHARIEFGAVNENGHRTFYVRDNGVGFDMQFAHKLFGAFQRLHAAQEFEGTGVGLATVQRVITRHGGRVWADAKVGHGAAFFFTLPS